MDEYYYFMFVEMNEGQNSNLTMSRKWLKSQN